MTPRDWRDYLLHIGATNVSVEDMGIGVDGVHKLAVRYTRDGKACGLADHYDRACFAAMVAMVDEFNAAKALAT